jgi:formylglycine-generating enzyme required for sulfatase activity
MFRAFGFALILMVPLAAAQPAGPPAGRRIALIIGNDKYTKLKPLPYVARQVPLMADALSKANFEVHVVQDFEWPAYIEQANKFMRELRPGDLCLVYYAGYAVQGMPDDQHPDVTPDNYLLPVNFDPASTADIEQRAYHFKRLRDMLEDQKAALKIFIIDASPQIDAPIAGVRAGDIGLMEPPIQGSHETLYVSPAFPNQWAPAVPEGSTSPLTAAILRHIAEPGLTVDELFAKVKKDVGSSSGDAQIPDIRSSVVMETFYFHDPVKVASAPPSEPVWPRPGIPVANRKDREEYVWIPPRKFMMGCVPGDSHCHPAESPRHEVTLTKGFWMGRNEVQVGSYRRYVALEKTAGGKKLSMPRLSWSADDYPMQSITWEEAAGYCQWAGGRLPTEAEWEYAARGGPSDEIYPMNREDSRDKANFAGKAGNDIYDGLAPVRKFDPNNFGLFDMAGNVWEWLNDWFSDSYFTAAPVTDPQGPPTGKEHVIRGGSYDSDPREHLRISFRKGFGKPAPGVGFRCAVDDNPITRKSLPEAVIK